MASRGIWWWLKEKKCIDATGVGVWNQEIN